MAARSPSARKKHAERQRAYRARHPERVRASNLAWRKANPERERARKRAWREANRDRRNASERAAHLKRTFGITAEQYDEMLRAQGGVCAICGGVSPSGKRLAVDHDHDTGQVRGLLCVPCNAALGVLEANFNETLTYLGCHRGS